MRFKGHKEERFFFPVPLITFPDVEDLIRCSPRKRGTSRCIRAPTILACSAFKSRTASRLSAAVANTSAARSISSAYQWVIWLGYTFGNCARVWSDFITDKDPPLSKLYTLPITPVIIIEKS